MRIARPLPFIAVLFLAACATTPQEQTAPAAPSTPAAQGEQAPTAGAAAPSTPSETGAAAETPMGMPQDRSVYFDFDKSNIKSQYDNVIDQNAKYAQANADTRVRLEGNCDERGSREYNLALGQRRAEAVMKAMALLGVPNNRMEAISYGEEHPRAKGHNEEAWAQNRRTDIVYQGK